MAAAPRRILLLATAVAALLPAGCGGDGAPDAPVDRETFIRTYVDLRLSALGTPTGVITDAERTRVLEEHQVTEEELMGFADAWGSEPERMKAVWEEVQRRLRAAAGEDTTTGGGPGS